MLMRPLCLACGVVGWWSGKIYLIEGLKLWCGGVEVVAFALWRMEVEVMNERGTRGNIIYECNGCVVWNTETKMYTG